MDDRIESWVQRGKELAEECFTGGAVAEGCCRVGEDDELREEVVSALVAHLRTTPEGYRLLKSGANLERENEALRKDAERYRWLRSRDLDAIDKGGVFAGMTPRNVVLNEEHLDAAIDAALKEQSKC